MGERDAIADSDQGRSFRAFWDFLMSSSRQEELTELLAIVLALPPVMALHPDARTRRVHYDWLEAGEHTQRTVAQLSQQLRRFLDDQAWLENRRIMDILHGIEAHAVALRDTLPTGTVMNIADLAADIDLAMERPLHTPSSKPIITAFDMAGEDVEVDASALFMQVVIDKQRLIHHIRHSLQDRSQISLRELIDKQALQQGLAELVAYLQLGDEAFQTVVDESTEDLIHWQVIDADGGVAHKRARLPRVIFMLNSV
jgi:hypothetical protein